MSLLWLHDNGPCFISDSIPSFFCLFVFIHLSCSWVTKYLECESLCSSCTRNRNNSYDNNNNKKKNMTKWYRRHSPGGLVYCCIVTLEGGKKKVVPELNHFHRRATFCTNGTILCVCSHNHYYSMYLYIAGFASMCARRKKKIYIYMCLMVMLPIRHLNINIKHQSTNSHGEISCYWLL